MKKALFIVGIAISPFVGLAQVDYSKIIVPSTVKDVEFQEKLVQLAWKNHPANRIVEHEVVVQKELKKQARADWTKGFGVQGNLNEFTLNPSNEVAAARSAFYPRYNIYGRLSLDLIFVNPAKKRESNYRIKLAEEAVNEQKLQVRSAVLSAYQDYVKFTALYKIQAAVTEDAQATFMAIEKRFKDGNLTFEDYNKANRAFLEHRRDKIVAENSYLKSKYNLEELIGAKMEDIQ